MFLEPDLMLTTEGQDISDSAVLILAFFNVAYKSLMDDCTFQIYVNMHCAVLSFLLLNSCKMEGKKLNQVNQTELTKQCESNVKIKKKYQLDYQTTTTQCLSLNQFLYLYCSQ